jgi:mannan endo-1,4-beta-mannosidase
VTPKQSLEIPLLLQALDFVISEARNHKMRLILSLCNNWEDYGGKAQYVRWGKEAGLDLTSDDDAFFSHATIKSYYKAFVKVNVLLAWPKMDS